MLLVHQMLCAVVEQEELFALIVVVGAIFAEPLHRAMVQWVVHGIADGA
jgi:hypothetical protein